LCLAEKNVKTKLRLFAAEETNLGIVFAHFFATPRD
jgi:hypothetical protein